MVAGIINLCGAFGGVMAGPNENNEKGMFENVLVRQDMTKPFLRSIEADHMGQYPLPSIPDMSVPLWWRDEVENIMKLEGLKEDEPWMLKDAKMSLMWPVWHHAFPDAKWIVVRRKTSDIIHSCMHTGFMTAFKDKKKLSGINAATEYDGWYWWVEEYRARFVEMISEGLNVKQVWPERMVGRDYGQTEEMLKWLDLEWTDDIFGFIEPKLWKARQKK
jgi:hypothetical protein